MVHLENRSPALRREWISPALRRNNSQTGNAMQRFELRPCIDLKGLVPPLYWILITFVISSLSQNSDVIPPVIIEGPPIHLVFNPKGMISLPCTANGTVPLTYEWLRNGEHLESKPDSKILIENDGRLKLNLPDEGFYQCRVENSAGVAVSNITHLQAAVFEVSNRRQATDDIAVDEFQSLLRPCYHIIRSIPTATIEWQYENRTQVNLNDRVFATDNGSLVFASLLPSDSNSYKCVASNSETRRTIGGSYFNLTVNKVDGGNPDRTPQLIYSSNYTVRVLEGRPFNLSCIFGGVDIADVHWTLPNTKTLSRRWHLHFSNAKLSDEGEYTCSARKGVKVSKDIKVIVDVPPRLEVPLQGQRVQRGNSAHFTCLGIGRPTPTASWIINGTSYNSTEHNSTQPIGFQYRASDSYRGNNLVLHNVQSSASVACNVSNKYGYQLSSSYLIVSDTVATTASSQSQSSVMTSSPGVTSRGMTSPTSRDGGGSSIPLSPRTRSSMGSGEVVKTSTTFSTGTNEIKEEKHSNVSGSAESITMILVPIVIVVVILIILTVVFICLIRRHRRNKDSYSLHPEGQNLELKADYNRDQTFDSDDSGYDDVGRKTNASLKHTKRLSDTPEETYQSQL